MSKFIGKLADVGIAKEAVRGTVETTASFWLPKTSLSIDDEIEQAVDESSVGVIEDATDAKVVGKRAVAEIEGNITDKSFGLILLSTLGAVNTTGPAETSVYTHAFSVLQSAQHPSLTVFLDDPNQDYQYALGVIDSLEIEAAVGKYATYKASIRSKAGATATITPSYTAENPFLPHHISLAYAANLAGLSSPTSVDVRSVKLKISKNPEDDYKLGSLDQADILTRDFAVEGTLELVFNDNTFKTEMLADTAKAVRLRLSNSNVTIGSTLHPQITFDMAKVKFGKFERGYGNSDIVTATVDFKAFYSISDAKMLTGELINTQASY